MSFTNESDDGWDKYESSSRSSDRALCRFPQLSFPSEALSLDFLK